MNFKSSQHLKAYLARLSCPEEIILDFDTPITNVELNEYLRLLSLSKAERRLKSLTIENAELSQFMCHWPLRALERLNLSHNALRILPALTQMPALVSLNLSHNEISFPYRDPQGPINLPSKTLESLDLSHNKIVQAPILVGIPRIKGINLAGNPYLVSSEAPALPRASTSQTASKSKAITGALKALPQAPNTAIRINKWFEDNVPFNDEFLNLRLTALEDRLTHTNEAPLLSATDTGRVVLDSEAARQHMPQTEPMREKSSGNNSANATCRQQSFMPKFHSTPQRSASTQPFIHHGVRPGVLSDLRRVKGLPSRMVKKFK